MFKTIQSLVAACALASLAACGGGGGSGGSSITSSADNNSQTNTPPQCPSFSAATFPLANAVASTAQFQFRAAHTNDIQWQTPVRFTLSGVVGCKLANGSGGFYFSGAPRASVFEGRVALEKTIVFYGVANNNAFSVNSFEYSDSNSLLLGSKYDDSYEVVDGAANIPLTARLNDTGVLYTLTRYADITKTKKIGTAIVTYALLADTATTALLQRTQVNQDTAGKATSTSTSVTRITPAGDLTYISSVTKYENGDVLQLVF